MSFTENYTYDFDSVFDKAFKKMTRGMEDHEFKHYNNSLGCQIYCKEHYYNEMKKKRMMPVDVAEQLAEEYDSRNANKKYDDISPEAMEVIRSIKMTADKNGNIQLGGCAIEALGKMGFLPKKFESETINLSGGFSA